MTEQHENFPNGLEATLLIALLFVVEMFVASFLLSLDTFSSVHPMDLSGLIAVASNGVLFCFLLTYKKLSYATLFHASRRSAGATLAVLAIPIVLLVPGLMLIAGAFNSIVISLLPMAPEDRALFDAMMASDTLAVLFGCIAAPLLEEMLFRGVILRSFLQQYSRTAAILGSAALFGLAHLNVYQLATAFALGIVAGWLYERTRSLWPCILLHATYNGFVTYSYGLFATEGEDFSGGFYLGAFALAIGSGLFLLRVLMPASVRAR